MKSHNLLTVAHPDKVKRYYVDSRRVTREAFERIWDSAWCDGTLDSLATRIAKDGTTRHYACARIVQ